jgi:hypothetical protein
MLFSPFKNKNAERIDRPAQARYTDYLCVSFLITPIATPRSDAPTKTMTSGLLVISVHTCDTRSVIVDTPEVIAVVSPARTEIGII